MVYITSLTSYFSFPVVLLLFVKWSALLPVHQCLFVIGYMLQNLSLNYVVNPGLTYRVDKHLLVNSGLVKGNWSQIKKRYTEYPDLAS